MSFLIKNLNIIQSNLIFLKDENQKFCNKRNIAQSYRKTLIIANSFPEKRSFWQNFGDQQEGLY